MLATVYILKSRASQYSNLVIKGFAKTGLQPFNREVVIWGKHTPDASLSRADSSGSNSESRAHDTRVSTQSVTAAKEAREILEGIEDLPVDRRVSAIDAAVELLVKRIPSSTREIQLAALLPVAKDDLKLPKKNLSIGRCGTLTTKAKLNAILASPATNEFKIKAKKAKQKQQAKAAAILAAAQASDTDTENESDLVQDSQQPENLHSMTQLMQPMGRGIARNAGPPARFAGAKALSMRQ